jgi:hypothetical protein
VLDPRDPLRSSSASSTEISVARHQDRSSVERSAPGSAELRLERVPDRADMTGVPLFRSENR